VSDGGVSPVPREARPFQGRPAGLVSRFVASGIDALVGVGLLLGGYAARAGAVFLVDPSGFTPPEPSRWLSLTATLVVLQLYLAASWWLAGRSYGGHVMGLRVVRRGGGRLGPVLALVRAVLCLLLPLGLLWCAVDRRSRSLQDVVLGTSVVYDWRPRAGLPPTTRAAPTITQEG
jgi:uncharacterized RDD family membrane protein YckC